MLGPDEITLYMRFKALQGDVNQTTGTIGKDQKI
jgi:hypothetical protein